MFEMQCENMCKSFPSLEIIFVSNTPRPTKDLYNMEAQNSYNNK